jgi:hypothetical protein
VVYDTIIVEDLPPAVLLPAAKVVNGDASEKVDEERNDSNESFSASETDGEVAETGGLDSAGEEEETEEQMDLW